MKRVSMPDKKDIESISTDLMLKLSEAEDICQGLIETAKEYNAQDHPYGLPK